MDRKAVAVIVILSEGTPLGAAINRKKLVWRRWNIDTNNLEFLRRLQKAETPKDPATLAKTSGNVANRLCGSCFIWRSAF